jgi:hypothetical protein
MQDITLRESELTALRKQIEREYEEKVRIEESIMEKLRSHMTLDKAAQYSKKVTDKIKKRGTELVGPVENLCINEGRTTSLDGTLVYCWFTTEHRGAITLLAANKLYKFNM